MFQLEVEDTFFDLSLNGTLPELTLSDVITDFIRDVGGPDTISAFKKKYPWADAVFQQARTECIKNLKLKAGTGNAFTRAA